MLTNTLFGTHPVVVHAQGSHTLKIHWPPIKRWFYDQPARAIGPIRDTTIITCNNGHASMGALEASLDHLGVPHVVLGAGIDPWCNSTDKPRVLRDGLAEIDTPYTLYIDSRDAIVIDDPHVIVDGFEAAFDCDLLFGADSLNWPNVPAFKRFEDSIAEPESDFKYLNGGIWFGRTAVARDFFARATEMEPIPEAPESEQGMLKKLFPEFHPRLQLDYRCRLFQNIGFVVQPIFELDDRPHPGVPSPTTTAATARAARNGNE